MKKIMWYLIILIVAGSLVMWGCTGKKAELGSAQRPIKMYFVPSGEVNKIISDASPLKNYLEAKTGYKFEIAVPLSYAAVIEAMGADQADVAWFAPFSYVLANKKYGAELAFTTVRHGLKKYRAQFVVRSDSPIQSINDLNGKTIAYTDPASTSGHLYPAAMLRTMGIKPAGTIFAGGHPQAIEAVYSGRTDAGCTFWSPGINGVPQDARMLLAQTHPDIYDKVRILALTDSIPNDTVTLRAGLPQEVKDKIKQALLEFAGTPEGKKCLQSLYTIDGLAPGNDADYDAIRNKPLDNNDL